MKGSVGGFLRDWKQKLAFTGIYLSVVALMWLFRIPCIFQALFHLPCPGCGMTRACLALCRLDFIAAFSYHPMFWSVPLVYWYLLNDGILFGKKADRIFLLAVAVGFLLQWIPKVIVGF